MKVFFKLRTLTLTQTQTYRLIDLATWCLGDSESRCLKKRSATVTVALHILSVSVSQRLSVLKLPSE
jgi:hypothetical protein